MVDFSCLGSSRASVPPKDAEWIKQSVVSFDPDNNKLTTSEGDEISYEFLVVAMGLQLNYNEVRRSNEDFLVVLGGFDRHFQASDHFPLSSAADETLQHGNKFLGMPRIKPE